MFILCLCFVYLFTSWSKACVSIEKLPIPSSLHIQCNHDNITTKYPMYWMHDGHIVGWVLSPYHKLVYDNDYTVSLSRLDGLSLYGVDFAGEYSCNFLHEQNCLNPSAAVNITFDKTVIRRTTGQSVTLDCKHGAGQDIMWLKNDAVVAFDGQVLYNHQMIVTVAGQYLNINHVNVSDAGRYYCKTFTSRSLNTFLVDIDGKMNGESLAFVEDLDVSVTQTKNELKFEVRNVSSFDHFYIMANGKIMMMLSRGKLWFLNPKRIVGLIQHNNYIIEIKERCEADSGTYKIIVRNGELHRRKIVNVKISAEIRKSCLGESLYFLCLACGSRSPYWKKDDAVISIGHVNFTNSYIPLQNGSKLLIRNLTSSQSGHYSCYANRRLSSFYLRVENCSTGEPIPTTELKSSTSPKPSTTQPSTTTQLKTTTDDHTQTRVVVRTDDKDENFTNVYVALGAVAGILCVTVICLTSWLHYARRRYERQRENSPN